MKRFATRLIRGNTTRREDPFRAIVPPLYLTATFAQPGGLEPGPYDYSRSGNPTRALLEGVLADLEGGAGAAAFSSGMAALASVLRCVPTGGLVVAGADLYGGTCRLLGALAEKRILRLRFCELERPEAVEEALTPETALVWMETPSNPLLRVTPIGPVARAAHAVGAKLCVDNSLLSPVLQRPLEEGADLVVHSATKFLGGHSDVTGGIVIARDEETLGAIRFWQNAEGAGLAPFDAWLILRGLETLHVRMKRQEESLVHLVRILAEERDLTLHTLPGAMGRDGPAGGVFAFQTGAVERSRRIVESTRLFDIAVSFGSVHATISLPAAMSHASVPEALRGAKSVVPADLVRVSVGLEDPHDLADDLLQAIRFARRR